MRHVKLSAGGQRDCGDGSWPDVDLTGCDTLEVKKLNPSNPLSIFALGLACFGIILQLAFATFGFYYRLTIHGHQWGTKGRRYGLA